MRGFLAVIVVLFLGFLVEVARDYSMHVASLIVVGAIFGAVIAALIGLNAIELPEPSVSSNTPASE